MDIYLILFGYQDGRAPLQVVRGFLVRVWFHDARERERCRR